MSQRFLYVEENWVDRTRNIRTGESGVYETRFAHVGDLFRFLRSEYGRCTSKMYVDTLELGPAPARTKTAPKVIGWVFVKRDRYEDTGEPYLLETWVTVHEKRPTRTVKYHYADLKAA
jgi:hypothetical protein